MAGTVSQLFPPRFQLTSFASPSAYGPRATFNHLSIRRSIRCQAWDDKWPDSVVRRNLLIGLGGATALYGVTPPAFADPIVTPLIKECHKATPDRNPNPTEEDSACCPPGYEKNPTPVDYVLPPVTKLRVRTAAHLMSKENIEKYEAATQAMRDLKEDDPLSFVQQAKVHCAYCDAAYDQDKFPGKQIQVHSSSLFQPFHRWYIYFYERILGSLIKDPEFALPFWNWDHPDGMTMPAIFVKDGSPLNNSTRLATNLPPKLIDFQTGTDFTPDEQIEANLCYLYRMLVSNSKKPELFFGKKYVGGDDPTPGVGNIETIHNRPHAWTSKDMGAYYSSGKDPLFYSHHGNVDRIWELWLNKIPGGSRKNIRSPDWLDSSFLFYNEDRQLVRVYVRDCLDISKLGYTYADVDAPWIRRKPQKSTAGPAVQFKVLKEPTFPVVLKSPITATIKRPVKSRSAAQKAAVEEVLVIDGLKLDARFESQFDVYINAPDVQSLGPAPAEFAGSFSNVPHTSKTGKGMEDEPPTRARFGITDMLNEIDADNDDTITVTIVPRRGRNKVTVSSIGIELTSE